MSGASQTMSRQAAVAHNLANVSTSGYKAEAHRLRAVQVQAQGNARQTALPTRAFAADASMYDDFTAGPVMATGNMMDMAIRGKGWIALAMPDGTEAYTRAGHMEVSVNGILQTANGTPVQGDGGPISIPPDNKIVFGEDGTVSVLPQTGSQATANIIGRIKLVNPPEADLRRGEDGLFRLVGGAAAPNDPSVSLASGFIEGSNVNPVEEMVNMISLARQFEMQIKMLTTAETNDRAGAQILAAR